MFISSFQGFGGSVSMLDLVSGCYFQFYFLTLVHVFMCCS